VATSNTINILIDMPPTNVVLLVIDGNLDCNLTKVGDYVSIQRVVTYPDGNTN
jgi:hypothetical protein